MRHLLFSTLALTLAWAPGAWAAPPTWSSGVFSGHVSTSSIPPLPANDGVLRLASDPTTWSQSELDTHTNVNTMDTLDPNGGNAAVKAVDTTVSGPHEVYIQFNSNTYPAGQHLCAVDYVKVGTTGAPIGYFFVQVVSAPTYRSYTVVINGTTGAVTDTLSAGVPVATEQQIVAVGNNWYRFAVCATFQSSTVDFMVFGFSDSAMPSYGANHDPVYSGVPSYGYMYGPAGP